MTATTPPATATATTATSTDAVADDTAPAHRDLLTPTQLADRWGISTGHLANLRHQGEGIGYLKIGTRVAYRYTDVLAYENDHYVPVA